MKVFEPSSFGYIVAQMMGSLNRLASYYYGLEQPDFKGEWMLKRAEEVHTSWAYAAEEGQGKDLTLLDNVQFIYELALAQMELGAFGVDYQITNGLREFKLFKAENEEKLRRRLAYFKYVRGKSTDYYRIIQHNRTRSVNQYLTHWIYPYKGKFHPQMIRALLNFIQVEPGDKVLDPFIGSGTTAVEAQLLGIDCLGIDVSPLCVLQSKVKTESVYHSTRIKDYAEEVKSRVARFTLGSSNMNQIIEAAPDGGVKDFVRMANLVAVSDTERRHRDFLRSFLENLGLMVESVTDYEKAVRELNLKLGKVTIEEGDSRALPYADGSIDGIITSPPYSIALDYVANDAHALKELGYDPEKMRPKFVGVRGKGPDRVQLYNQDMIKSIGEMHRVLKSGKFAVIVVGNATYLGEEVKTVQFVIDHAQKVGFERKPEFKLVKNVDKIIFGLYNVMQKENILIFQKQ
jgi:DNA modification methylase